MRIRDIIESRLDNLQLKARSKIEQDAFHLGVLVGIDLSNLLVSIEDSEARKIACKNVIEIVLILLDEKRRTNEDSQA